MTAYDELVEGLTWLLTNRVQSKINYSHGLLGDGQGRVRVAGHEDFVYARPDRFNSRTQQVFNKRVEGQDGDPIIIGELPWEPGLTQVISIDWRTYKEIGWGGDTSGFVYHGRTHIWKDAAPGLDTFPVYRRQLGDLQATASVSGTNAVDISSYSIELYGAQKQFPGTIGFPLDNAVPAGTGTARMALLYWDPSSGTTGYIGVATGTTGIDSESTLLNRPVSLPGTLPIAFVRLNAGMAGITEFNIFDAREPFRPGIGFGTGSSQFNASLIPIFDNGGFFTGTSVESALQEIGDGGAHAHDASDVSIADAGGYYTGTSVESALQEIGGGSLPGDTFEVSELWDSNFGAVAWQTDAAGHLSATGKNLTTTGDISANDFTASGNVLLTSGATKVAGSGSSNPSLGTEASDGRWGNIFVASGTQINTLGNMDISAGAIGSEVVMIRLNNTAQDALYLGAMPSTSDDVDININDGQVFIRGSDGYVGIASQAPQKLLQVGAGTDVPTQSGDGIYIAVEGSTQLGVRNTLSNVEGGLFCHTDGNVYIGSWTGSPLKIRTGNANRIDIDASGNIVVNESGADVDVRFESNDDANLLFLDGGNNAVLIGTTSHAAANKFKVVQTHTDHLAGVFSVETSLTANLSSGATGQTYRGMNFAAQMDGSGGNTGDLTGVVGLAAYNQTSGTLATLQCGTFSSRVTNAGDVTNGYGVRTIAILSSTGNMTNWRGFEVRSPSISGAGGITTAYGVYLAQQEVTGVTTGWGVYQAGADDDNYFAGKVGAGTNSIAAQLHVDQSSTTAAIPALYLDQADVSEEMIEFNTTIGTGNAIEAVGAKTLTTTHFIKVTLPGGLTRYIPVGTIA